MDTERVLFLVAGVLVVAVVGRLLVHSGRRYLATSEASAHGSAGSAAALVSTLFHLVTLGLVALIAVLPFNGDLQQNFLLRIGFLLIVLALAYGVALMMLSRRRQEQLASSIDSHIQEAELQRSEPAQAEKETPGQRT
ncbi:hypothetical protein [Kutzneria albida]|uniref:Uncharacterized protein n=1 Tax=Kutzneria albida DSM 43870 TaxID=1449976 RepID=W5WAK3_9PSEU|nr:hypothetical protein [Kutzneria albida]AHH97972.1 hypothetical protein KALB_4610 [Kutzneria albida DSM 43870]